MFELKRVRLGAHGRVVLSDVVERSDECMRSMLVPLVAETNVVVVVAGQASALADMKSLQPRVVLDMTQKSCLCS